MIKLVPIILSLILLSERFKFFRVFRGETFLVQMVLFIGIPASGKSSFYLERFYATHVRVNLDMLKTRHRERLLLDACLAGKTKLVIDNTNVTRAQRTPYIQAAKAAGFTVVGYYFETDIDAAIQRNANRPEAQRVPKVALYSARKRLEIPSFAEGFEALHLVRLRAEGGFVLKEMRKRPATRSRRGE